MLRRMVSDPAPDSSGDGGGEAARPRAGAALFAVSSRVFVGFAAKLPSDGNGRSRRVGESSRSPTSPLDTKALLLRSPRSPRTWGALGLVDALAGDATNCLLSPRLRLKSYSSLPKNCGGGGGVYSPPELGKTMSCPAPDTAAAAGMSVPCSRFHLGNLKSGPEATQSDGANLSNGSARQARSSKAITMVVALGPARFYGSSLPRPRFFPGDRVDLPASVTDLLLAWAQELSHRDRGSTRRSSFPGTSSQIAERERTRTAAGTPVELDPAARPRRHRNSTAPHTERKAKPKRCIRKKSRGCLHRDKAREAKRKQSAPINQHREGRRPSCLRFIRRRTSPWAASASSASDDNASDGDSDEEEAAVQERILKRIRMCARRGRDGRGHRQRGGRFLPALLHLPKMVRRRKKRWDDASLADRQDPQKIDV